MYAAYFGLSREPFTLAPDPRFLYMSERHREALAHLLYGVRGGGGFVVLTGEIGAGKTTVTRCFLEQLPPQCVVAYIFNPCLSVLELLQTVCSEFNLPALPPGASAKAHVDALNSFLLEAHAQGRQALLVIDEAQALDPALLEQLRLLTNLETAERKLLQIMLIGQPELRDMLGSPGLEQLAQRVVARYHLGPLSAAETGQYVQHRWQVASPNATLPFDARALSLLHRLSGGVPRRINLLADRALLGAYGQRKRSVDAPMVQKAAQEVFGLRARSPGTRWAEGLAWAALVAGLVMVGLWVWQRSMPAADGPAQVLAAPARPASAAPPARASASAALPAPPASAARPPPLADPGALVAAALPTEDLAWRELALHWNVAIGEGEACAVAPQAQLACYRSATGGLQGVRQLARPVALVLRADSGPRVYALLVALDDTRATLQAGRQRFELSLPALAAVWRGEFLTLWRTPPGWGSATGSTLSPAARAWIEQRLPPVASASASAPGSYRERLAAFQLVQGLQPNSPLGPVTLMHLNRSAGVDEPRLAEPARR